MKLNEKLKEIRKERKLTQKELSLKTNIPYATYNKYETTQTQPDIETLCQLADYYNVSLDYLVGRDFGNQLGYLTDEQFSNIQLILNLNEKNQYKVFGYALSLLENQ